MSAVVLRGGGSLVVPVTKHGVVMRRSTTRWLHLYDKQVQRNENNCVWLLPGVRRLVTTNQHTTRRTITTSSSTGTTPMEPSAAHLHNALRPNPNYAWAWTLAGGFCLVGVFAVNKGLQVVPTGQVAVVEILGVVQADLLSAGMHWVNPMATVTMFSLQPQHLHVQAPNSRVRGGLFVDMDMIVVYKFHPDKIKDLYIQMGHHNNNNINFIKSDNDPWHLEAITRSVLQSVVARRTVDEVHKTHQLAIAQEIQQLLLEQFRPTPLHEVIQIDQVVLKNVTLPDYFIDSIQELHRLDLAISAEKRAAHQKFIQAKAVADSANFVKRNLHNLHNNNNNNNHQQHGVVAPSTPATNHNNRNDSNTNTIATKHPQHPQTPNKIGAPTAVAPNSKARVPAAVASMQPKAETKVTSAVATNTRRTTATVQVDVAKSTQSSINKDDKQILPPAAATSITTTTSSSSQNKNSNTTSNATATAVKKLHPKATTQVSSRDAATPSPSSKVANANDTAAATNAAVAAREKQP